MRSIKDDAYWDKWISIYILVYFLIQATNLTIKSIINIPNSYWGIISIVFGIIILVFMLKSLHIVWRRSARLLLGSLFVFVILYLISFIFATIRNESYLLILKNSAFLTFAWWIPVGVYAASIKNYRILYETLVKGSFALSSVLFTCFFFRNNIDSANVYNMSFGFAMVFPTLIHINEFNRTKKVSLLILSIVEAIILLLYANRGVFLSIVFFVVYIILFGEKPVYKKIINAMVLLCILFFSVFYQEKIILTISDVLTIFNTESRTFSLFINGDIGNTSGRDVIWRYSISMFNEHPLLGWGLGGEYYKLTELFTGYKIEDTVIMTHNAIIQFFVEFGLIGGTILSFLFIKPVFGIHKITDQYRYSLVLICLAASVIPCLISASEPLAKPLTAICFYLYYKK